MSRRTPSSLRGPTPDRDSFRKLSEDLTRFAKSNLRDPDKALAALRASSPSPDRLPVTTSDLIRQSGRDPIQPSDVVRPGSPVAQESHGALLRPQVRRRYGPAALASPAPHVSTSAPEAFKYTAAGSGATVTPGPVRWVS